MSHSNIAACRFGAFWSRLPLPRQSWFLGAGYLSLYLLLDWASYVQAVRHTSITPWNPTAGLVMALLLVRGSRWAPLVALGIFVGELLTDDAPAPWRVLAVGSRDLAPAYTPAARGFRPRRPVQTHRHPQASPALRPGDLGRAASRRAGCHDQRLPRAGRAGGGARAHSGVDSALRRAVPAALPRHHRAVPRCAGGAARRGAAQDTRAGRGT